MKRSRPSAAPPFVTKVLPTPIPWEPPAEPLAFSDLLGTGTIDQRLGKAMKDKFDQNFRGMAVTRSFLDERLDRIPIQAFKPWVVTTHAPDETLEAPVAIEPGTSLVEALKQLGYKINSTGKTLTIEEQIDTQLKKSGSCVPKCQPLVNLEVAPGGVPLLVTDRVAKIYAEALRANRLYLDPPDPMKYITGPIT